MRKRRRIKNPRGGVQLDPPLARQGLIHIYNTPSLVWNIDDGDDGEDGDVFFMYFKKLKLGC